jgi:broad specificity phosphatase PhoE
MILLVRHGETEWNVERRFQGRRDSPLTERGRRQADAMAGLVRDLVRRDPSQDWRLVASPLGRTVATAEAIARATGLAPELDARLAEVDCGEWEGMLWSEVVAQHSAGISARQLIFSSPGGETYDAVLGRIESFLAELPPEPARRVVVVSHGGAGRLIRGAYGGLPKETILTLEVPHAAVWRLANGQIDRFDCEPVD